MLKSERAIGNYFELPKNSLRISPQDRESMVSLIQELHRVKGYAEDTFYLAVSIADRYLTVLATKGQKAPNLIQLATISILLAAKMYQHMNPCFDMMIERLPTLLREQVTREQLIGLEELIIRALDFDLQHDGPLPFLERYQRVLGIDVESTNGFYFKIGYSARKLLRHMMHKATFLSYRPSQVAATAILVAIDLNKAEGSAEQEQYEQMCQAQVIASPRKPDNSSFSSTSGVATTSHHTRKFNTMLQNCEESELRGNKGAISPPSNSSRNDQSPTKG